VNRYILASGLKVFLIIWLNTSTTVRGQAVLGKRMSSGGKLHLLGHVVSDGNTQMTLCGRRIRVKSSLPVENFDFGAECCSCCSAASKPPAVNFHQHSVLGAIA
jgi:hypothetical protein